MRVNIYVYQKIRSVSTRPYGFSLNEKEHLDTKRNAEGLKSYQSWLDAELKDGDKLDNVVCVGDNALLHYFSK
jgi:hypothetical protein